MAELFNNSAAAADEQGSNQSMNALGNFGVRINLRANTSSVVKGLVCKVFGGSSPLPEELVSVMELRCPDEGCPDLETIILIFDEHDQDSKLRLKIKKPISEVMECDVKELFTEHQATQGTPSSPCGCCEPNIEKQRSGCPCCGFILTSVPSDTTMRAEQVDTSSIVGAAASCIHLTVSALVGGDKWSLELDPSTTIGAVKSKIEQMGGPMEICQRYLFRGRQLENHASLSDSGIEEGANIVLVRDLKIAGNTR
jgi:hypothetical protein